jgi:hypothetical protein
LLAAGGLVLLSSPRHRAFYFGKPPLTGEQGRTLPEPPSHRLNVSMPFGRVVASAIQPAAVLINGRRIPVPDLAGQLRVPVADEVPRRLPAEGVPTGWDLHEFAGQASVELLRDEGRLAMRLRSERSSYVLSRDVVVDLREFPYLTWTWTVPKLPAGGDVREPGRDDQAAQVYVVSPRWPAPRTGSEVLGYVWDTRAPVGTRQVNRRADNVRVFVVESGPGRVDAWQMQQRNVFRDYVTAFGKQPSRVGKVAIMIDTDDTRGEAEALVGELIFSKTPATSMEIATSVLR